jgi:hypothetical protein
MASFFDPFSGMILCAGTFLLSDWLRVSAHFRFQKGISLPEHSVFIDYFSTKLTAIPILL